jgi:hypothetical protein
MLPVSVVGTFFSPSPSSTMVRLVLSAAVSGDGWELPRGTLLLGRVGATVAKNRVEVSVVGFIDPARNRFVKMGGEISDQYGVVGLPGEIKNRKSLLARIGSGALQALPGAVNGVTRSYVYPNIGIVPGADLGANNASQEYVLVGAGTQGFVMVRNIPESEPSKDAGGQLSPEEMELIRSLRQSQGNGGR